MYIKEITEREYKTLDFVKGKKNEELPSFDTVTQEIFKNSSNVEAPLISLQYKQAVCLDRSGIERIIRQRENETKHKILSVIAVAAAVTLAVAAFVAVIVFAPYLAGVAFIAGILAVAATGAYPAWVFDISQRLQRATTDTESIQKDVDDLIKFMDSHGNQLLTTLEDQLQEMKPETQEDLNKKQDMDRAAMQLRLAAQFVAEYVQQDNKEI